MGISRDVPYKLENAQSEKFAMADRKDRDISLFGTTECGV